METTNTNLPERVDGVVYVYGLFDPRTDEIRYVGVSVDPKRRLKGHLYFAKRRFRYYSSRWIASLLDKNLSPVMRIVEPATTDNWQERECFWIAHYRQSGAKLTNLSDGGYGVTLTRSPELRRLISQRISESKKAAFQALSIAEQESIRDRARKIMTSLSPDQKSHWAERYREALASRPEHEKQATRQKQSEARKRLFKSMPAEEREAYSDRCKAVQASKTTEQKAVMAEKTKAFWASLSDEQRSELKANLSAVHLRRFASMTPQERQDYLERRKAEGASMTPEQRAKMSAMAKGGWDSLSPDQRVEQIAKSRDGQISYLASLSPEQRKEFKARKRAASLAAHASKTPEQNWHTPKNENGCFNHCPTKKRPSEADVFLRARKPPFSH